MSWKVTGLTSKHRFATALEAGKHGVDLAVVLLQTDPSRVDVHINVEESDEPVNAVHDVNETRSLS
jgi:hypothetical protein